MGMLGIGNGAVFQLVPRRFPRPIPIAPSARRYEGPGRRQDYLRSRRHSLWPLLCSWRAKLRRYWGEALSIARACSASGSLARNLIAADENRLNNAGHPLPFERAGDDGITRPEPL